MNAAKRQTLRKFWESPVASVLIYCGVICLSTWPLAEWSCSALPVGPVNSLTVPMFNLWTIWWNADQAWSGFPSYWHAPIFFPAADAFAFSEPQPTTLLVAPVIWLTGSRVLAYNVYYGLSFLLNAVMTERLLRLQSIGRLLARSGGVAMILLPILQWQRDVLQLIPIWGILWIWIAFTKLSRASRLRHGFELGVAAATTCLMCMYYGLFTAILSAGTGWILVRRWRVRATWIAWGWGAAVSVILAGPLIWHVLQVLNSHQFVREHDLIADLSIRPGDYTAAWGHGLIPWGRMSAREQWQMSPGWIKVGLASLGIGLGLLRRRTRRWTLFLALTAGLGFLLSLGTNLQWGGFSIWEFLSRTVPGFSQVRSPFRFAVFVQIITVLLAVQALHVIVLWSRRHSGRWGQIARCLVCILAECVAFETLPWQTTCWMVPDVERHRGWISFVQRETPPGRAILCLPFATGQAVFQFEATTQWMYFGTFHKVPLVNGYSGFFPANEPRWRGELERSGITPEQLDRLGQTGVEFLILDSRAADELYSIPEQTSTLIIEKVFHDPTGIEIYRLIRR